MFNIASNNNEIRSQIDFNLLPKNCPSLCIPRVFANIGEARIRKTFEDICIGRIEGIDIIKGNQNSNRVVIHLSWNNTPDAQFVRNQVMTGKDVKIIYDKQWFWMVSAFRNQPPKPAPAPLSYKTDEYGREIRPTHRHQQQPPLLRYDQEQQPPLLRYDQEQTRSNPRNREQPPRSNPRNREQPPRSNPRYQEQRYQEQEQEPLTDAFGRDVRRRPPPPSTPPPPTTTTTTRTTTRKIDPKKSWATESDDDDEEEEEDYNEKELQRIKRQIEEEAKSKPNTKFIPESPTSTPPSMRRKQILPQQQEQQEQQEQEQESSDEETEDFKKPVSTTTSANYDVDKPRQVDLVEIKYNVVLPVQKIRTKK